VGMLSQSDSNGTSPQQGVYRRGRAENAVESRAPAQALSIFVLSWQRTLEHPPAR
jgi:hypothetical protein